jgi:SAM-dependent methyltransferase
VVRPGTRFLDLGSGDGRVVFMAAHLGAHATGIEYERRLHRIARAARRQLTEYLETGRTRFVRGDFFDHDFSGYDVLFYFGRGSFGEDRLLGKIRTELRSDAILLFSYPPGDLPGMTRIAIHGQVSVYRIDSEGE